MYELLETVDSPADLRRLDRARLQQLADELRDAGRTAVFAGNRQGVQGVLAVADTLRVSPATVRNHVQNILGKLAVHSRLEAVAFAARHRLF